MEFRLTYAGRLLAHPSDRDKLPQRSLHVHEIRKAFHKQMAVLWRVHPVLLKQSPAHVGPVAGTEQKFNRQGFEFLPIATMANGLICKLEILLLRGDKPGDVLFDIDNRLKTLFDALRMPTGPDELGAHTPSGLQKPEEYEKPFYVLLEDDKLITHVAVTSDRMLEAVPNVCSADAVRIVLDVAIRPYDVHMDNLSFT